MTRLLFVLGLTGCATTSTIVVRHAEKLDGSNPSLTEAGQARADALQATLAGTPLAAIHATDTCRTVLTAQPTALAQGLAIQVPRDPDSTNLDACVPEVTSEIISIDAQYGAPDALAEHITAQTKGGSVLVVGHSNTAPAITSAVSGQATTELLPECEFDHLFVVTSRGTTSDLVWARYGPANPADCAH